MLGFLIVIISGVAAAVFATKGLHSSGWGIFFGVLGALVAWAVLGLVLRRKIAAQQQKVQDIMQMAQIKINRQMEMFQRRPPSSEKAARQIMEKIQNDAVRNALAELDNFKRFYKWNLMLSKQVNTMKVQLYFQLREYNKVDELLPSAFLFDVQTVAIKLVRLYKTENAGLDKFFRSKVRRFKGDSRAFFASVYAWMKLKQGKDQDALDALLDSKTTTDHQVMMDNIERLSNGKSKHYSNSGFGDMWYALGLEEPKVKPQRQMRGY